MPWETLLSVSLGVALSAACGFRVFIPVLVLGIAARAGQLELQPSFDWLSGNPALIALAVAAFVEVVAYYVPWLDHLLDHLAGPVAVVAGIVVTASVIIGMEPWLRWALAVIAGGGAAGVTQALTTGARYATTYGTAGLLNPLVSTVELGSSLLLAVLAVIVPLLALLLLVGAIAGARRLRAWRPRPT